MSLVFVVQPVRILKEGVGASESQGALVHHLGKPLHRATDLNRNHVRRIVGTAQHQTLQQGVGSQFFAWLNMQTALTHFVHPWRADDDVTGISIFNEQQGCKNLRGAGRIADLVGVFDQRMMPEAASITTARSAVSLGSAPWLYAKVGTAKRRLNICEQ